MMTRLWCDRRRGSCAVVRSTVSGSRPFATERTLPPIEVPYGSTGGARCGNRVAGPPGMPTTLTTSPGRCSKFPGFVPTFLHRRERIDSRSSFRSIDSIDKRPPFRTPRRCKCQLSVLGEPAGGAVGFGGDRRDCRATAGGLSWVAAGCFASRDVVVNVPGVGDSTTGARQTSEHGEDAARLHARHHAQIDCGHAEFGP